MSDLHETHVCRDCGAEITLPYAETAPELRKPQTPTASQLSDPRAEALRGECPSCHHPDHDPGSCREGCGARCELHTDDALDFILRVEPELLARRGFVLALPTEPAPDVERLEEAISEALNAVDDEWTVSELAELTYAKLARREDG